MITREDIKNIVINRQMTHIRLVQDYMIILEENKEKLPFKIEDFELIRRAMLHDYTKFSNEQINGFIKIAQYYENKKLGIQDDSINKTSLYECSNLHYCSEPHHIEHHIRHNTTMSDIDICEMCCDIAATSDRNKQEDYTAYFLDVLCKQYEFFEQKKFDFLAILDILMVNKITKYYSDDNIETHNAYHRK